MSVLEIARFTAARGNGDELERAVKIAVEQVLADSTALKVEIYRAIEVPEQFTWLIWWTSVEAHMNWRDSERMKSLLEICGPLLAAEIGDAFVHHSLVVSPGRGVDARLEESHRGRVAETMWGHRLAPERGTRPRRSLGVPGDGPSS